MRMGKISVGYLEDCIHVREEDGGLYLSSY